MHKEISAREIWVNWMKDQSRPKVKLNGRVFYWLFDALFEKNRGVTSTRVSKHDAESVFNAIKEGKAEFVKEGMPV
jgi:hypothetical protein